MQRGGFSERGRGRGGSSLRREERSINSLWLDDSPAEDIALKKKIEDVLSTYNLFAGEGEKYIPRLLTDEIIQKVWKRTLVHPNLFSSFPNNKYVLNSRFEEMEFLGDKMMGGSFAKMLMLKFYDSPSLSASNMTLLDGTYMSEGFQSIMAQNMGLLDLFIVHKNELNDKQKGDILEAFIGALTVAAYYASIPADEMIFNLLVDYFAKIKEKIDIENVEKEPVAYATTLAAKVGAKIDWRFTSSDKTDYEVYGEIWLDGKSLGRDYGASVAEVKKANYKKVVDTLTQDRRLKDYEQNKEKEMFEKVNFEKALEEYNSRAEGSRKKKILRYRVEERKTNTQNIQKLIVAYDEGNGRQTWTVLAQGIENIKTTNSYLSAKQKAFQSGIKQLNLDK